MSHSCTTIQQKQRKYKKHNKTHINEDTTTDTTINTAINLESNNKQISLNKIYNYVRTNFHLRNRT